jgi:hypothetical protein
MKNYFSCFRTPSRQFFLKLENIGLTVGFPFRCDDFESTCQSIRVGLKRMRGRIVIIVAAIYLYVHHCDTKIQR